MIKLKELHEHTNKTKTGAYEHAALAWSSDDSQDGYASLNMLSSDSEIGLMEMGGEDQKRENIIGYYQAETEDEERWGRNLLMHLESKETRKIQGEDRKVEEWYKELLKDWEFGE